MMKKLILCKICFYFLFFLIIISILYTLTNFKGLPSTSSNLWTITKHSQLYHFSIFFSKTLEPINKGIIIYYPSNQKQLNINKSIFVKKFWGGIPNILLSPTITKNKLYDSELSLSEYKHLKSKSVSFTWFKNRRFNYVLLSEAWKEEKNWAIYEYVKNKRSFIFLLPLNWRQNLK